MKIKLNHLVQMFLDVIAVNLAWFAALVLRFDGKIPSLYLDNWLGIALLVTLIRISVFYFFKLYRSLWSYSSVPEFFLVVKGVSVSTLIIWSFALLSQRVGLLPFPTPKAIGIIDWMLNILILEGLRFAIRFRREWVITRLNAKNTIRKNLLIVGAGEAGSMIIKEIRKELGANYLPVGFIDDDPHKQGHNLHGVPILGNCEELPRLVKQYDIKEVIIALPSASRQEIREIIDLAQQTPVHILMIPAMTEIINGTVSLQQLRDVAIEDLLGREPVQVDLDSMAGYLCHECILVTGAGGSIGGELSLQIARFNPEKLLLLGRGENSIYEIEQKLRTVFPQINIVPIIADVRDRDKLNQIFKLYRPTVVFHAAAHKHVPLMEHEPDEAIKNNIFGTKNMVELAAEYHAKRFVLISTDKAVNPSSVMGATKRVAELIVQEMSTRSRTKFMAVRFGNVLGSRGSVVPLFCKQIAQGGPVTVTSPEMTRFFMTIPEAVQLVIQAGALGQGGEVFILDMGEPVRIYDLAQKLIRLSGYTPEKDIKIVFTGVRPGEKLYEEILTQDEGVRMTKHERIYTTQVQTIENGELYERLNFLQDHLLDNPAILRGMLQRLAPEFLPWKEIENMKATGE